MRVLWKDFFLANEKYQFKDHNFFSRKKQNKQPHSYTIT